MVKRVIELWEALKEFFRRESEVETLNKVKHLHQALNNDLIKLYLTFLCYILPVVNKINLRFQAEASQLPFMYDQISTLYKTILKNYLHASYVDQTPLLQINPKHTDKYLRNQDLYLGEGVAELLTKCSLSDNKKTDFFNSCLSFYVELCTQIRKRFSNLNLFENFRLLQPSVVLKENKKVTPLLLQFQHLVDETKKQEIADEYREIANVPLDVKKYLESLEFDKFWFKVYEMKNLEMQPLFASICDFVFNLMSLPHSSAAAERIFSAVNLIKTKPRNRLLATTCNSLLLTKGLIHDNPCYKWVPEKAVLERKIKYT